MLSDENSIWWIILFCALAFGLYYYHTTEFFEDKKKKKAKIGSKKSKDLIGKAKVVHVMNLHPIIPNIVPLRDQVNLWIVNVPLTPFTAPLVTLPPLRPGERLPMFLLYKMEYLTPVRNQGECGACWAFAVCDMLSDRAMIASGGLFQHNLSVQQLLSCFAPDGCDGGSPEEASYWLSDTRTKLFTEKKVKYKQFKGGAVSSKCPKNKSGYSVQVDQESVRSIVEYIDETGYDESILLSNIENMKKELYEGGPFYCAMAVYDDFFSYSGLKPYKPGKNATLIGGHAIEVIGYCEPGEDPREKFSETGYWICKNSWGKDWPTQTTLDGYFTIVMGRNICGIESRCGFATPKIFGKKFKGVPKPLKELRYESYDEYMS